MSNDTGGDALDALLHELDSRVRARVAAADRPLFKDFLRRYYEPASLQLLTLRSPDELFDIAHGHWRLAQTRKPGESRIEFLPAAGTRLLAVLRTVIDDLPFLYDTVGMALRAAGTSIDWTVHPVLMVQRDSAGRLTRVEGVAPEGGAESLMHFEFEPLAQPADYALLEKSLRQVLGELRTCVADYPAVRSRVKELAARPVPGKVDAEEFTEACEFLRWLEGDRFTFLGYSESRMEAGRGFVDVPSQALGLLRAGGRFEDTGEYIAPREELSKYAGSKRVLVVSKGNVRSPIHHPEYFDVVSVKHFDAKGAVAGVSRFVGLFASEVYLSRVRDTPLLRRKADYVLTRSRLPEQSHSGKNLRGILQEMPRDELFQTNEGELYETCMSIRALRDRNQLRLFLRRDRYGRFYSAMVYLPRDRYSREIRDRVAAELVSVCRGSSVDTNVDFLRGGLTRLHYIVRTEPGTTITQGTPEVEQRLLAVTRSWKDQLREALRTGHEGGAAMAARFGDAFPPDYTAVIPPLKAAADVHCLSQLTSEHPVLPRLAEGEPTLSLKLYSHAKSIPLSEVLPTLENFGLRAIRQVPTEVHPRDGEVLWVQQFDVELPSAEKLSDARRAEFESAFLRTWVGDYENDGLNQLILLAGLGARQVLCLRTMLKYLIQTGLPFSQAYMEQLLSGHSVIANRLVRLFEVRFDPALDGKKRKTEELKLAQELDALLDKVATLDGDRVLRAFLSVVRASLRTNFYQVDGQGRPKGYVSLKLDPKLVPELPQPLPMFEIFVYSPEFEGIHLRGGRVARGGLRWSDRKQDFRTEVLGLMKAQQVKNAIIVPVGAKGGFVVKRGDPANREVWLKRGIECYRMFLGGLLDITDNRVGDAVVVRPAIVRYDEDDPYLVVAADKGTATFSDIANAVSADYGHWLGDAFASGGSAGYDHKKMGITARGAWESVKRHFREISWTDDAGVLRAGKDIQVEEITVAGVGDMSGDVFGNGMLLSRKIRLLAAFDHRHLFLDPNPDAEASFRERERMFALPRSSWDDYNKDLISAGGGVFSRTLKIIKLSPEMQKVLEVRKTNFTPAELMHAILKAPVDLFWNGGIGTYVKGQHQSHPECGDRANDAVRVDGRDLRCKVVGEGGNLGCTQPGRIEAALAGVRLNTDFIDNAGGVHSSDREVNIKIPLNGLMLAGRLKREDRDPFLASLTDDIASSVLRDNYVQSLAISLLERGAGSRLDEHANLMRVLEREGLLNRAVEYLPDDETLNERRSRNQGLTRPEISVLISYSKISLFDALLKSSIPDDPFFDRDLIDYFPARLVEKYRETLLGHRLRREIIATILSNAVVNRMGVAFTHLFAENHGLPLADVVKAYATAHEIYDGDRYWRPIQALDGQIPSPLQLRLYGRAVGLMKHATTWLLTRRWSAPSVGDGVATFQKGIAELTRMLPDILPPSYRSEWDKATAGMEKDGTPRELAMHLANTMVVGSAPDIVELASRRGVSLKEAAGVYFQIGDRLRVLWLLSSIIALNAQGKWQALARHNLREDTYLLHRQIADRILAQPGKTPEQRVDHWMAANEDRVKFGMQRLQELQAGGVHEFMTLAVGVRELRKLRSL